MTINQLVRKTIKYSNKERLKEAASYTDLTFRIMESPYFLAQLEKSVRESLKLEESVKMSAVIKLAGNILSDPKNFPDVNSVRRFIAGSVHNDLDTRAQEYLQKNKGDSEAYRKLPEMDFPQMKVALMQFLHKHGYDRWLPKEGSFGRRLNPPKEHPFAFLIDTLITGKKREEWERALKEHPNASIGELLDLVYPKT